MEKAKMLEAENAMKGLEVEPKARDGGLEGAADATLKGV